MPAHLNIGVIKANNVSQGAALSLGVNVVQNRNTVKQNIANFVVGDGSHYLPTHRITNFDNDVLDAQSIDLNNYAGVQL